MLAFVTFFSCISAFCFGYDLGLIGGALLHLKTTFDIGDGVAEVIVGAAKLGAVGGTFVGGALMLYYGRRKTIAIDSIFFALGPIIMAAAWNVAGLIIGRFIVGIGIGISAVVVPAYLGEVAPAKIRGRVVELYEVMLCLGMLCAALIDAALDNVPGNWRWMVGAPVFPAVIMALAACLLPESPRWLVMHSRLEEALGVMHKVHTSKALPLGVHSSTAEVEAELMELWSSVEKDKDATTRQRLGFNQSNNSSNNNNKDVLYNNNINNFSSGSSRPPRPPLRGDEYEGTALTVGMTSSLLHTHNKNNNNAAHHQRSSSFNRSDSGGIDSDGGSSIVDSSQVLDIPPSLPRIRTRSSDCLNTMVDGFNNNNTSGIGSNEATNTAYTNNNEPQRANKNINSDTRYTNNNNSNVGPPSLPQSRTSIQIVPSEEDDINNTDDHNVLLKPQTVGSRDGFWRTAWTMMKDIIIVAKGPEHAAFRMACILAFFNQAFASTAVINYAPTVLQHAGVDSGAAAAYFTSIIGGAKLVGVTIAFFLVDSLGRRQLLIWGSIGSAASLVALIPADWFDSHWLLITGMSVFILCFSLSWAGVFWVLLSEIFSMAAKSPAASAATAVLFLTGAIADLLFLTLHSVLGPFVFLLYAIVAMAAAVYVAIAVPETKGRTLQEVQDLIARRNANNGDNGRFRRTNGEFEGLIPSNSLNSGAGVSVELPAQGFGRSM